MNNKYYPLFVSVFLSFIATACGNVDLKSVRSLSEQGIITTSVYDDVMKDVLDSCIRSLEYEISASDDPIDEIGTSLPIIQVEDSVVSENPKLRQLLQNCIDNFEIQDISQIQNDIEAIEQDQVNEITQAILLNKILSEYFAAIGELAGVRVNFNSEVDELANAVNALLENTTSIEFQEEIEAGGQILAFVLEIASRSIRAKNLKTEITARNEDVQIVINALQETIESYKVRLFAEEQAFNRFYARGLNPEKFSGNSGRPINYSPSEILIFNEWSIKRNELREKINFADTYIISLKELKEAHNRVSTILAQSYEDNQISQEEINNINEAIAQHAEEMEYLVKELEQSLDKLQK